MHDEGDDQIYFCPTPNCTLSILSQEVVFIATFCRNGFFLPLINFVTMHKIGPRILMENILYVEYRYDIFEGSGKQYFLRGVG